MIMLNKLLTHLKSIAQFFIQKPAADLTWRWVWDDDADKAIAPYRNPLVAHYASFANKKLSSPDSSAEAGWTPEKLIAMSEANARGFGLGVNPPVSHH